MKQKRALLTLWASALLALPMQAQQTGEWVTHDAYHDATACTMAGPLVFGLYDSHLMSYDTETEEVRTYKACTATRYAAWPTARRVNKSY